MIAMIPIMDVIVPIVDHTMNTVKNIVPTMDDASVAYRPSMTVMAASADHHHHHRRLAPTKKASFEPLPMIFHTDDIGTWTTATTVVSDNFFGTTDVTVANRQPLLRPRPPLPDSSSTH